MIEILASPNRSSPDLMGCIRLPRVNDPVKPRQPRHVEQHVNMIRHHAPRLQFIPLSVEMPKSVSDDTAMFAKNPAALTSVENRIEPSTEHPMRLVALD